jgi:hypothetical protein
MNNIPLIVVSTDSYSDTWEIFFKMFFRHYPSYSERIYLVTETLSFDYRNVKVINTVHNNSISISWGESLLRALEQIDDEIIFFMLDDFILTSRVNENILNDALAFFVNNSCDFLTLSTHDFKRKHQSIHENSNYVKVKSFSPYRITTSPALWRKKALISYLDSNINPWQFEILGTIRSYLRSDNIYMLNSKKFNLLNEPVPYYYSNGLDTAIVRGKWQNDAIHKFPEFIDKIQKRGIVENYESLKQKTYKKILSKPLVAIEYILKSFKL